MFKDLLDCQSNVLLASKVRHVTVVCNVNTDHNRGDASLSHGFVLLVIKE